jgi:hypothetical protein
MLSERFLEGPESFIGFQCCNMEGNFQLFNIIHMDSQSTVSVSFVRCQLQKVNDRNRQEIFEIVM